MRYKPNKYIEVGTDFSGAENVPLIRGTKISIKRVIEEMAYGTSIADLAKKWHTTEDEIVFAVVETARTLYQPKPVKLELILHKEDGPVSASLDVNENLELQDIVDVSLRLWEHIKRGDINPYSIWIKAVGPRKIPMIKLIREVTGCGLKEAKDKIESAPFLIPISENWMPTDGNQKTDFEYITKKLQEFGAEYELLGKNETEVHKVLNG